MIADRYRRLLEHLGPTAPITELFGSEAMNIVGLRHDVDHDLGVALDMSAMERLLGDRRATYFILHTHPYCTETMFLDRLRQLVDDGHEIGVHLDAIGAWWRGDSADPIGDLERWLDRVRRAGIDVAASAAHGAKACYEGGFANHWLWSELRGADPAATMNGISAEGVPTDDPAFRLGYPADHLVRRPDGEVLELWSASLSGLGLAYEACTIPVGGYWSDSGGEWKRSPNPLSHDLSRGRHQVLVHPWWWREGRRSAFLLAAAGSCTEQLQERFRRSTSALTLRNRTLDQQGSTVDPVVGLPRTEGDLVGLLADSERLARLVEAGVAGHRRTRRDVVEFSDHLAQVSPSLLQHDDVVIVHLHRDPSVVVRRLLEEGWYDTADDRRHPRVRSAEPAGLDQFEMVCRYWAMTNLKLIRDHPDAVRIPLEWLDTGTSEFDTLIGALGLVRHRSIPVDAGDREGRTASKIVATEWTDAERALLVDICGPVASALGRRLDVVSDLGSSANPGGIDIVVTQDHAEVPRLPPQAGGVNGGEAKPSESRRGPLTVVGRGPEGSIELRPRGGWGERCRRWRRLHSAGQRVLEGSIRLAARGCELAARLVVVEQDAAGRIVEVRSLARIEPGMNDASFAVRLRPETRSIKPEIRVDSVEDEWFFRITEMGWNVKSTRSIPRDPGDRMADSTVLLEPSEERRSSMREAHRRRKLYRPADYRILLEDFEGHEFLTLQEYVRLPEHADRQILVIRHDVDHDLETAVEMATWEAANGIRSTYSLLHTAWYWGEFDGRRYRRSRDLVRAGERILSLGHEVNLHNNLAVLALQTGCDPAVVLDAELGFMRGLGWPVTGTATHGDALCRSLEFRNFELFSHAVKPEFGGPRVVATTEGAVRLGSLDLDEFGLEYEAYDLHRDVMITDSGGRLLGQRSVPGRRWFGRSDPSRGSLASLLTHPLWWNFRDDSGG